MAPLTLKPKVAKAINDAKRRTLPITVKAKINPLKDKGDFNTIKGLLNASYNPATQSVGNAQKDKSLSGKRVSVFHDATTSKTYVAHRGTHSLKDWATDLAMGLGYERGNRFKFAKKIQSQVEAKYGKNNVITTGHSLGGRIAEKVGSKSAQIITYNKASIPRSVLGSYIKPLPKKQTDIRTRNDIVSLLSGLQKSKNPVSQIESTSWNPITSHNIKHMGWNHLIKP